MIRILFFTFAVVAVIGMLAVCAPKMSETDARVAYTVLGRLVEQHELPKTELRIEP